MIFQETRYPKLIQITLLEKQPSRKQSNSISSWHLISPPHISSSLPSLFRESCYWIDCQYVVRSGWDQLSTQMVRKSMMDSLKNKNFRAKHFLGYILFWTPVLDRSNMVSFMSLLWSKRELRWDIAKEGSDKSLKYFLECIHHTGNERGTFTWLHEKINCKNMSTFYKRFFTEQNI